MAQKYSPEQLAGLLREPAMREMKAQAARARSKPRTIASGTITKAAYDGAGDRSERSLANMRRGDAGWSATEADASRKARGLAPLGERWQARTKKFASKSTRDAFIAEAAMAMARKQEGVPTLRADEIAVIEECLYVDSETYEIILSETQRIREEAWDNARALSKSLQQVQPAPMMPVQAYTQDWSRILPQRVPTMPIFDGVITTGTTIPWKQQPQITPEQEAVQMQMQSLLEIMARGIDANLPDVPYAAEDMLIDDEDRPAPVPAAPAPLAPTVPSAPVRRGFYHED